jgi:hypothetical protein
MRLRFAVTALAFALFAISLFGSVTGNVAGPDGVAIAKAKVTLFRPVPLMLAVRENTRDHHPAAIVSGTTDQNGRFDLDAGGAGLVDVHIVADGFAPADAIITAAEVAGTIVLKRATLVTGRITANGKPVAGAFVLAMPSGEGMATTATTDADGIDRIHIRFAGAPARSRVANLRRRIPGYRRPRRVRRDVADELQAPSVRTACRRQAIVGDRFSRRCRYCVDDGR